MKNIQHIHRTFFKQHYHHDCGVACIKTVLSYFGLSTSNIPKLIEENTGIHLLTIKNQLQAYGIAVNAYECDRLNWPSIKTISLMVTETPSGSHAVILYPERDKYHYKNRYLVGNPASGVSWVEKQEIHWNGTLLTFDYKKHQSNQVAPLKLILKQQWLVFRENALFFNIIIFWGLLINLLTLAVPLIFQNGLDQFKLGQQIDQLIPVVLLVFFILFLRTAIVYLRQQLLSNFSKTYYHHSFKCWFKDLLKNNVRFWNTLNQGDFNQLLKEQHQLQQLNLLSMTEILNDLMLLVFLIGLCFYYSVLIGITLFIFMVFNQIYLLTKASPLGLKQEALKNNYAMAEQDFTSWCKGYEHLHVTQMKEEQGKKVIAQFGGLYNSIKDYGYYHNYIQFILSFQNILLYATVICILLYQYSINLLSLGSLFSLIGLTYYVVPIVARLGNSLKLFYEQVPTYKKRTDYALMKDENELTIDIFSNFQLIDLGIFPNDPQKQLINLRIDQGDFILIKGANGCGKSTLLKILAGALPYHQGKLLVNQRLLNNNYQIQGLAYLKQDIPIYDGTVAYNITMSEIDEQKFSEFISLFKLNEFISGFKNGASTQLSSSHINLSGGQRRILGLARELYRKPQILLLDEPEQGLDVNYLNWLLAILPIINKKTTIVVTSHINCFDPFVNKVYRLE